MSNNAKNKQQCTAVRGEDSRGRMYRLENTQRLHTGTQPDVETRENQVLFLDVTEHFASSMKSCTLTPSLARQSCHCARARTCTRECSANDDVL